MLRDLQADRVWRVMCFDEGALYPVFPSARVAEQFARQIYSEVLDYWVDRGRSGAIVVGLRGMVIGWWIFLGRISGFVRAWVHYNVETEKTGFRERVVVSWEEIVCARGCSDEVVWFVRECEESPRDVGVLCGDCLEKRGEDLVVGRLADEIRWTHSTLRELFGQQQSLLTMMGDLLQRVDRLECDRDEAQEPIEF